MLARLLPLLPSFGVTRLAVLTGLDVIGIPVAGAVRPNSRTVSVHQGKGATLAQAKVSALMEALECACAETADLPLHLAEAAALGEAALDVTRLPRCAGGPDPRDVRLLWVQGYDLGSGAPVWVPRELVTVDFCAPPVPGAGVFQATTNGLASGATTAQAALHGLCEAIERDAVALWQARGPEVRARCQVDPAGVGGPAAGALLRRCQAAGQAVTLWDVTSDIGVPVFMCLLVDPTGVVQPELGSACRPDADAALAAAIAEAAQARVTTISGARDDMPPESFSHAAQTGRAAAAQAMANTMANTMASTGGRPFVARDIGAGDPSAAVLRHLEAAGIGRPAAVTLTRADLRIPVLRIVVPGLEGLFDPDGEYRPGARAA
jgi:ribosomal protein S12 methylthiotransferase accessory factor